jgi:hypothetical protein
LKSDPGHTFRANGLDTLRAAAITLVFMNHYMAFVSGTATFGWASVVGWTGVDLFFVLSGYLIANQIFAGLARGATLSRRSFYARRALRTLPVFWLVLALYFLFPAVMGGNTPPPLWRFLTFTQNIGLHGGTAFSHAWSLCIEEQFYLILPLALVIGTGCRFGRSQGWTLRRCDYIGGGGRAALPAGGGAIHGTSGSALSNQLRPGPWTAAVEYAAGSCADTGQGRGTRLIRNGLHFGHGTGFRHRLCRWTRENGRGVHGRCRPQSRAPRAQ